MLQLLNPIWLFGISGILIPLIIHLWNIKTGKTLKVGSITLMGESSRQNSRSLKLMELLLLFLRCLLIILVSLLLAEPVWKSLDTAQENKDWILIEKENFKEAYNNFKSEIDSLAAAGKELHLFEPGFTEAELEEILQDSTAADTSEKLSYWSLVRLLDKQIPQGSKAFIYTTDRASRFKGPRPSTATAFNWKTFTPADSTSKWIDHSYLSSTGNIRAIVSESNPGGTVIQTLDISPGDETAGVQTSIANGQPQVKLKEQTVIADTSTLTIAINAQGFPNDAGYLRAAISAIQKYTSRKIKIVSPESKQDILFWLSDKALSGDIKPGTTVFQYAKGKAISTNTWLKMTKGVSDMQAGNIPVHKRISYPDKANAFAIWEDGFGNALLDLKKTNDNALYTFYSRFDPSWTELVWSPDFVKLLMPILVDKKRDEFEWELDKRSLGGEQYLPITVGRAESGKLKAEESEDLKYYVWLLLTIVFVIERYYSTRNSLN